MDLVELPAFARRRFGNAARKRRSRALRRVGDLAGAGITLREASETAVNVHVDERRRARAPAAQELRRMIEEVVRAAAPEVQTIQIDGLTEAAPAQLVQLTAAPATISNGKTAAP